jgi:SRSO17 transposase
MTVKAVALQLKPSAWRPISWREGTNGTLSSRFARVRVRAAHRDYLRTGMPEEQWLLIEWPAAEVEPTKYWLSTVPADIRITQLVDIAKMRWRIEHDYHELKQEFGLSHYEGRGWLGFHHHATLCIAAYGFLSAQRLKQASKKNTARLQAATLPEDYQPRGSRPSTTSRPRLDSNIALPRQHSPRASSAAMPVLCGSGEARVTQYD